MKSQAWIKLILLTWLGLLALPGSHQLASAQEAGVGWSAPLNLSNSETQSLYPSLVVDPSGGVHVIWQEEIEDGRIFIRYAGLKDGAWSQPNEILTSPESQAADYPTLAADAQGYLHVVFRGDATLYYSRAYAPLAGSAQSWSEPQALEYAQNYLGRPHLQIDAQDRLHLVYSIGLGGKSGIYYQQSSDGGRNWSEPAVVYRNNRSDRTVDLPRLAVAADGRLHAVWVEADYPETFPPLGIRYAASGDGGQTWSEVVSLADGPYSFPAILTAPTAVPEEEEVHVVYSGTQPDRYKFHRWSADGGQSWLEVLRNTEVGGFQGLPALVSDSSQAIHWLTSASIFKINLDGVYSIHWQAGEWQVSEVLLRNVTPDNNPGDVSAAVGLGNQLHVAVQYPIPSANQGGGSQSEIYYLRQDLSSPRLPGRTLAAPTTPPATPTSSQTVNLAATLPAILNTTPGQAGSPLAALMLGLLAALVVVLLLAWLASLRQRSSR